MFYSLSNLTPYNLGRPNFYFQTIKLCYVISNFAHIQVKFNTPDCLVENTDMMCNFIFNKIGGYIICIETSSKTRKN